MDGHDSRGHRQAWRLQRRSEVGDVLFLCGRSASMPSTGASVFFCPFSSWSLCSKHSHHRSTIFPLVSSLLVSSRLFSVRFLLFSVTDFFGVCAGGHTSWSRAWLVSLRARLFQGSEALASLRGVLRDQCVGSLFSLHPALTKTVGKELAECLSCFELRDEENQRSRCEVNYRVRFVRETRDVLIKRLNRTTAVSPIDALLAARKF